MQKADKPGKINIQNMKAISLLQPWAYLMAESIKDIENRSWKTNYRGRVLIHAGKKASSTEWALAQNLYYKITGKVLPAMDSLKFGGIVGMFTITGCVDKSDNPWFFGPFGWTVEDALTLPFTPCKGSLKFFVPDFLKIPENQLNLFSGE